MNHSQIIIETQNLTKFIGYLKDNMTFAYENNTSDMFVFADEEFYVRNNSTQLNLIIVKIEYGKIIIDLLGSAGRTGLLNIFIDSEKQFIKRTLKIIDRYIKENNLEYEDTVL